jgi:hypothetical protein
VSATPTENETEEPSIVTVANSKINQTVASDIEPGSVNFITFPAYYTADGNVKSMTLQDMYDTFAVENGINKTKQNMWKMPTTLKRAEQKPADKESDSSQEDDASQEDDSSQEGDEDETIVKVLKQHLHDLREKQRSRKRKSDKKAEQARKRIASEEDMFLALSRKYLKLQDYTAEVTRLLCDTRAVLSDLREECSNKRKKENR